MVKPLCNFGEKHEIWHKHTLGHTDQSWGKGQKYFPPFFKMAAIFKMAVNYALKC